VEESRRIGLARLQVVGPADRADARRAVAQRNEPEPAVIEPVQTDIAFFAARHALRIDEMAVERGTVVLGILALYAELVREKGVAPRGVDQELCMPLLQRAGFIAGSNAHAVFAQIDIGHARALQAARAFFHAVLPQDLIELRAPHLVGVRILGIPGFAEFERHGVAVLRGGEVGGVLREANALDLVADTELVEQSAETPDLGFEVTTRWDGQFRSETKVGPIRFGNGDTVIRDFVIKADEPEEILGSNEAPNPQELLMAALNACIAAWASNCAFCSSCGMSAAVAVA